MRICTKIICTIGPSCNSLEKIIALIDAGMSVARLNFSHGTHEEHQVTIDHLKEARRKTGKPLAIMLDTKGPEIRIGQLPAPLQLKKGQIINLIGAAATDRDDTIPLIPTNILTNLRQGISVLFDNGYIKSFVVEVLPQKVMVEIQTEGELKSGKGVNIPDVALDLPMVTDRDIEDIRFGCKNDIDMIAASFVNSQEQILLIRRLLAEENSSSIQLIAKIESLRGVQNFDAILQASDGVMIARGDLGVEVPLSRVPILQKMMVRKCFEGSRPSIIATQMLETMMFNSRPTRAEASDIANAIYDSGSAVMLSGETAAGKYPVESVLTMRSIIAEAEADFDYENFYARFKGKYRHDVPTAVSLASLKTAVNAGAKAIFVVTSSGRTARLLSGLRPHMPILALTSSEKIYNQLAFEWGVVPILCEGCSSVEEAFSIISRWALKEEYVRFGDLVVITSGAPFGVSGTTNMMLVQSIGDVAVRGREGYGQRVHGKVFLAYDPKGELPEANDKIIVLTKFRERHFSLLEKARGVILQNQRDDLESERALLVAARTQDVPVIVGADAATNLLYTNQVVTLDPPACLVYRGEFDL